MSVRLESENQKYKQNEKQGEYYSDFLHTFIPHPNTGQISRKVNVDSVTLALRNLLMTNKYERLRNPEFGSNIRRYLFEHFTATNAKEIEERIRETVITFEPRVKILDEEDDGVVVVMDEENNRIDITIKFAILHTNKVNVLDLTFYRVR